MPPDKLEQEVIEIVAAIAEVDSGQVAVDTPLEELGIDSLDGLRIVAAVEKKYGIVIDEEGIASIRTMHDVLELVRRYASEVE